MVSNNENIAHRKRSDQSNGKRPSLFSGNGENETKLTNEKRQKKEMIKKNNNRNDNASISNEQQICDCASMWTLRYFVY